MRGLIMVAGAVLLAGCGGSDGGGEAKPTEAATKLGAGLYEVTADVASLASTDKTTPATKAKQGEKMVVKACVGADGTLDPGLLGEAGDSCTSPSSYVRNGRLSVQLVCARAGHGNIMVTTDGKFTADTFEGSAHSETQFAGSGDYKMTRKLIAKRVGDCPAGGAKTAS